MLTCYHCAKTIKGDVKRTGVILAARMTGYNFTTGKSFDTDFPKAWHPACYAIVEDSTYDFTRLSEISLQFQYVTAKAKQRLAKRALLDANELLAAAKAEKKRRKESTKLAA